MQVFIPNCPLLFHTVIYRFFKLVRRMLEEMEKRFQANRLEALYLLVETRGIEPLTS